MPNKYPEKEGWNVPRQKYKLSNWPEYNKSLRRRGSIDVWLSPDATLHARDFSRQQQEAMIVSGALNK
ncbi:MAG: hypothetical protein Q8R24_03400 [Legionellaceae bacterium]|nr:hypothetical protein [Legionellaceae bacterium]